MITDSKFEFPRPLMSGRELKRARVFYRAAKWLSYLVLLAVLWLAVAGVKLVDKELLSDFPSWLMGVLAVTLYNVAVSCGEIFGLWMLRVKGLEAALQERRVVRRTRPEPPFMREAEWEEMRTPGHKSERLTGLAFLLVWAFLFAGFQLSIGYEGIEVALGYAVLSAIPALISALCFFYFMQDPRLRGATQGGTLDYQKFLAVVPWSQVAQVEELRSWNFTNSLAECQLIFRDDGGREIHQVTVPPYAAAEVFAQIEARLTGRATGVAS